jgi:serine/threonine-protein kinase
MAYAAPEFLEGRTSAASDQYALAVTYYQLRTGRLPFTGHMAQVLDGHRRRQADVSVLPQAAEQAAVARALAKDPLARWPNCLAFVAALASGPPRVAEPATEERQLAADPGAEPLPGPEATSAPASSRRKPRKRPKGGPAPTTSGKAIVCLLLGLFSVCLPLLSVVPAWLVGFVALREMRTRHRRPVLISTIPASMYCPPVVCVQ